MDLMSIRIALIKFLTWQITLVDEEPASKSNEVLKCFESTFSSFLLLFGVWCETWPTPRVLIVGEGRAAVRGEKAR